MSNLPEISSISQNASHSAEYGVSLSVSHALALPSEIVSSSIVDDSWALDFMAFALSSDLLEDLLDDVALVAFVFGAGLPVSVFCFFDLGGGESVPKKVYFTADCVSFDN